MSRTAVLVIMAVLTLCCAFGVWMFERACGQHDDKKAFWRKGAASLCFVLSGLAAAVYKQDSFSWIIFAGLVFGIVGDQLLALDYKSSNFFTVGAASFAVGHVLYIRALRLVAGNLIGPSLTILVIWMIGAAVYALFRKSNAGNLQVLGTIYIGLVALMSAKALAAAIKSPSPATILFAIGGFCFFLSDNILSAKCFGNRNDRVMDWAVHITYYAAQMLIAWSSFLI